MKILITGANGFVGQALCARLREAGHQVVAAVRRAQGLRDECVVGDIDGATDWTGSVERCGAVIHLAARVHVMHETATDPWMAFHQTNVAATLALARQAAAAGVRRFVFISSVKVNGEATVAGHPYTERDASAPEDAYGRSKMEAEQGLRAIAQETGMQCVIIRSPLVYGPGVRANFHALMRVVAWGLPLPLARVDNRRSLVGLDNLVDFIATCLVHPAAANETFLISDGADVSTAELIRQLALAMGRRPRMLSVPVVLLKLGATVLGQRAVFQRLCGDLQVDITKAHTILGWRAPRTLSEGLFAWLAPRRRS